MVRVANDDDAEKDPAVTLKHTVSGGGYDAVSPSSVTVTVEDNDTRGVRLYDPDTELEITELEITEGSTGTYRIALDYGADGNGDGDGERCLRRRNRESIASDLNQ